jgi:cation-transporting ATPase E
LAIGIPGFFLAFAPSQERFRPGFLRRALRFSVPAGAITALAILLAYAGARGVSATAAQSRTAAVIACGIASLTVLVLQARPLRPWKVGLVGAMAALFAGAFLVPGVNTFFQLQDWPPASALLQAVAYGAGASAVLWFISWLVSRGEPAPVPAFR